MYSGRDSLWGWLVVDGRPRVYVRLVIALCEFRDPLPSSLLASRLSHRMTAPEAPENMGALVLATVVHLENKNVNVNATE